MRDDHVDLYFLEPVVDKMVQSDILVGTGSSVDYSHVDLPFNHQETSGEDIHEIIIASSTNSYQNNIDNTRNAAFAKKGSMKYNKLKSSKLNHRPLGQEVKQEFLKQGDVLSKNKAEKRLKETKIIVCDNCKESFDSQSSYYFHRSSHINENGACSWLCAQCNECFYLEKDLQNHEVRVHGEIRPYPCPYCINSFLQYYALNDHIHRYHHQERPHKCTYCDQSFYRPFDLKTHIKIHLGIKKYNCHECDMTFNHPSNLTRHLRIHSGVKPYVCQICYKRFTHINTLRVHEMCHYKNISCPYCQVQLQNRLALKKHISHTHNDIGMKKMTRVCYCSVCGKSFKFKKELKLHEISHHNVPLKYSFCNDRKTPGEGFKNHACFLNEATRSQTPLSKYCEKKTDTDASIMDIHDDNTGIGNKLRSVNIEVIAINTDDDELTLSIKSVDSIIENEPKSKENNSFVNYENLKFLTHTKHRALNVSNESDLSLKIITKRSIQNSDCKDDDIKKFISSCEQDKSGSTSSIKVHNNEYLNLKNKKYVDLSCDSISKSAIKSKLRPIKEANFVCKRFKCTYCSKTFDKKWNFLQHLGIHDKSLRLFNCLECNLSFSYKTSYRAHCQSHTNSDLRYKCSLCPKSYKSKDGRYQHEQRFHSKVYKYHCETCKKDLFNKSDYTYHLRLHQKEFSYTCFACDKKFSHVSNLKRHERVHTGERPHKCLQCPKAFIQAVSLRNHLKSHDSDRIKKYEYDGNTNRLSASLDICHTKTVSVVSVESSLNQGKISYSDTIDVCNVNSAAQEVPTAASLDSNSVKASKTLSTLQNNQIEIKNVPVVWIFSDN